MEIIYLMIPMALLLGVGFLTAFIWAVRQGQFDDLETPKYKMLIDDNQKGKGK